MSNYSREDLAGGWEFKIVRSVTAAFRSPAVLEKLRQEEAGAGWVMVEKFDDARIRFKRAASAREDDFRLPQGVDPYRTYYGISNARFSLVVLLIIFGGIGLMFLLISIPIFLYLPNLMR